ncbi:ABC-2 family transporter protein [Frankia sp. CNm7]|uniref:ABC-2 family transporter protein n=1 Tax=Frankia nepalensis TaxID=1836974 RepID=A0A937RM60_9ACTN|nr:ABC-2 family transporter protein [Frankia nepalensis]MBL7498866.1 ABC-2 family transporter protein [Frankia nepalensis]MBL7513698.1 ABC-2 family transporter protein [Frankia nepalensis]MBL7524163.1 ABC-2 family transporter protein [Frankia nepalensis]MBL7631354.1 ABC-2 family transporter protein [Frankia nepalensis]
MAVEATRARPSEVWAEARAWAAVAAATAKVNVAYRATVAASTLSNVIMTVLRGYLAIAVWEARPGLAGYDLDDAITFVVLGQALVTTFAVFGGMIDVPWRVESGAIVVDLARPFGFLRWWLARELGRAAVFFASRAVPAGVVGVALFGAQPPASRAAGAAFAVSLALALLVGFAIRYLVAMTVFWTTDVRGVLAASSLALTFFSGAVLPLTIFPGVFGSVARALPFAAVLQVPMDVYLRPAGGAGIGQLLAFQAGWAAALFTVSWLVTRVALRRLVTQGG